jgi:hypothetical protein
MPRRKTNNDSHMTPKPGCASALPQKVASRRRKNAICLMLLRGLLNARRLQNIRAVFFAAERTMSGNQGT